MLTEEEKSWAKAHTDILINYRNAEDWIGNYGGDPLGIARYIVSYKNKEDKIEGLDILYYHGLSTWEFDEHGNLVDKYGLVEDKRTTRHRWMWMAVVQYFYNSFFFKTFFHGIKPFKLIHDIIK